eukprot:TRINITY_DN55228_c0_g1_i1.p1 TRINITY_DN55228_c0_g1~~TRINITY_DN55228_c0_g1_i1.p1  ORF type:complete len:741 (+),score=184.17 TRINITY_DN55228_c0_g1_i1:85-2223(+)
MGRDHTFSPQFAGSSAFSDASFAGGAAGTLRKRPSQVHFAQFGPSGDHRHPMGRSRDGPAGSSWRCASVHSRSSLIADPDGADLMPDAAEQVMQGLFSLHSWSPVRQHQIQDDWRHLITREEAEAERGLPRECDAIELWLRGILHRRWAKAKRQLYEGAAGIGAAATVTSKQIEEVLRAMQIADGEESVPEFATFAARKWSLESPEPGPVLLEAMLRNIDFGPTGGALPEDGNVFRSAAAAALRNNESYRWIAGVVREPWADLQQYLQQLWSQQGHGSDHTGPLLQDEQVWEVFTQFGLQVPDAARAVLFTRYGTEPRPGQQPLMRYEQMLAALECPVGPADLWCFRQQLGSITHGAARELFKRLHALGVSAPLLTEHALALAPDLPPRLGARSVTDRTPGHSRNATPRVERLDQDINFSIVTRSGHSLASASDPGGASIGEVLRAIAQEQGDAALPAEVEPEEETLSCKADALLLARRYPSSLPGRVRHALLARRRRLLAALEKADTAKSGHLPLEDFCDCVSSVCGSSISGWGAQVLSVLYNDSGTALRLAYRRLLSDVDIAEWPGPSPETPPADAPADERTLAELLALLHRKWALRNCPALARPGEGELSEEDLPPLLAGAVGLRCRRDAARQLAVQLCGGPPALRRQAFVEAGDLRKGVPLGEELCAPRPLVLSTRNLHKLVSWVDETLRAAMPSCAPRAESPASAAP